VDEDVRHAVGVARDQVAREAVEGAQRAVGGDRPVVAGVVALDARGVDAHALGDPGAAVVDEGVGRGVGVVRDQVGRVAVEEDDCPFAEMRAL
jgi:hypothetical protein